MLKFDLTVDGAEEHYFESPPKALRHVDVKRKVYKFSP